MTNVNISPVDTPEAPTNQLGGSEMTLIEQPRDPETGKFLPVPHKDITEPEMSEFFNRLATTLVSASAQAQELKRLKEEIVALNSRIDVVVHENNNLRDDVAKTYEFVRQAEAARDQAVKDLAHEREVNQRLTDTINYQNDRIAALEEQLATERATTRDLCNVRDSLQGQLSRAKGDVEYWNDRARRAEGTCDQHTTTISDLRRTIHSHQAEADALKATLAKVRSAFEDQAEAPQPSNVVGF